MGTMTEFRANRTYAEASLMDSCGKSDDSTAGQLKLSVLHCQMLAHEDMGMMQLGEVV